MNAFSSSVHTILFSLLFATLLVFAAGNTTASGEDVAEQDQKPISPDEYLTPEIADDSNVFWPPVHLRGLRSSNGKPTFIRFGKRASPSFIRFGRK